MRDGVLTGVTTKDVCRDCGYQGPPLIFDSEAEYKKFKDEISGDDNRIETGTENIGKEDEEEIIELTKQEKEVLNLLNETDENDSPPPKKRNYIKEFIVAIVLSILFMILLIAGRFFGLKDIDFFRNDTLTSVLFLIGDFTGVLIFFFLLIVILVTLYRSILTGTGKNK